MRAMILAAGLGLRMLPLTRNTPKPMLPVAGKPLLEHLVVRLVAQGIHELVINHSCHGAQLEQHFKDGGRWGARIRYAREGQSPLGTLAGVTKALPLLGTEPFLLVNADIWTDYAFGSLRKLERGICAHVVLVDNPAHHPEGDFPLRGGRILACGGPCYTYCGIGLYAPEVFRAEGDELGVRLRGLASTGRLTGEHYTGMWVDVGTADRLSEARRLAAAAAAGG